MKFNERLKEIRKEKGLRQKDLFTILKVSPNCYASWEQGRTQPNITDIKRLCAIFNVTADYLLGIENEYGEKEYTEEFSYSDGVHQINHRRKS